MTRREDNGAALEQAIAGHDFDQAKEALFRLIYGLPAAWIVAAGERAAQRAIAGLDQVPVPDAVRRLVTDAAGWVARHGRALPEGADDGGSAAATLAAGLDALLLAAAYADRPDVLASSAATAIDHAAAACAVRAWERDDPEAVALWLRLDGGAGDEADLDAVQAAAGRSVISNAVAVAARAQAWRAIAADLRAAGFAAAPDFGDPAQVERALARWRDNEYLAQVPQAPARG